MDKIKKTRVGRVISNKMNKTVTVAVDSLRPHPQYKRVVKQVSKFKAHDEESKCQLGDLVKIVECRPISKDKHWLVTEIITRKELAVIPLEVEVEEKP